MSLRSDIFDGASVRRLSWSHSEPFHFCGCLYLGHDGRSGGDVMVVIVLVGVVLDCGCACALHCGLSLSSI